MSTATDSWICIPITETDADAFLKTAEEAAPAADAIELRLDYLDDDGWMAVRKALLALASKISKPLILTFRPKQQGGMRELSLSQRQAFWRATLDDWNELIAYADLELDLVESLVSARLPPLPWNRVICSHHDFEETPSNLAEIYQRMARTPAAVVKIATRANRIGDCWRLFELLERRQADKPLIVLGMGLPGLMTRVLAPSRGAMLTFAALRRGAESAPGPPTADEMRDLYRVKELSPATEVYGVIGKPIGHSRSPLMHNAALKVRNRDGVYLPLEVDDLDQFVRDFVRPATRRFDWRLRGLSVTIPHKLAVIPHLDFMDPTAQAIGAVNTVVVEGDRLHGYNTDAAGAMNPLDRLIDVRDARVAVIGAGGSARAICYGLNQRGARITVYARDPGRAGLLAEQFGASAASIERFAGDAEVLINCTPIGMQGHSEGLSPVDAELLPGVKLVYDLVYNPEETRLLAEARRVGCRTLGGLSMLVGQAAEQFRLWTGLEAPVESMWQAVTGRRF
jgi:3-dehydroquinate dehydratase/shikimate dehydrogenase